MFTDDSLELSMQIFTNADVNHAVLPVEDGPNIMILVEKLASLKVQAEGST